MTTLPLFDWEPALPPELAPVAPPPAAPSMSSMSSGAPRATRTTAPDLLVIDATGLLFRCYYGMQPRFSPTGVQVGAVLGLSQQLLQIVRRSGVQRVALVHDAGRMTFRNRLDPRYKAHRGEPPADLVPQFDLALRLGQALGFAAYSVPDYEADDLMATLARQAREAGVAARLVSVDKDLCQLVRDGQPTTHLEDPKSGERCDEAGVRQRMGVAPTQVVDAMALVGDTSDNIPGVRGVGRQAAVALLEAFGDLEGIYRDLGRVEAMTLRGAKGLARKLEAGREEAFLARQLVRLCDSVPLDAVAGPTCGPGRAAAPSGPGGVLSQTRWHGPADPAADLFAELGTQGVLRAFFMLHASLA